MRKILIATDSYHDFPTANGICCEEIADELHKRGNDVHVLCFRHPGDKESEIINSIKISRIRMDIVNTLRFLYESRKKNDYIKCLFKNLMILTNRIEAVIFLRFFPMRTPIFCKRYFNALKSLQIHHNYDLIVASYCPFEAIWAMNEIKKYFPVKTCMYTLDSLTNLKKRFFLSADFQDKKGWEWERKIYEKCDLILNLQCHESHYNRERYNPYRGKMKIVDIPHMMNHSAEDVKVEKREDENEKITVVYAGALRNDIVKNVIDIFSPFLASDKIVFQIYGRSTIDVIKNICSDEELKNIKFNGIILHQKMLEIEYNSDILLSMGNANTDFVPSKIFEYMSMGGKILHIYSYKRDPVLPYLEKYENSCCLNVDDDIKENQNKLEIFLKKNSGRIPFSKLKNMYMMNTPEYTVDLLVKSADTN